MKIFIFALCILPTVALAQFDLVAPPDASSEVKDFVDQAEALMPQSMKQVINKKISVQFKELNYKDKIVWGQVRALKFNKSSASVVELHSKLLENIHTKNKYAFAQATLLHEISHIYDYQNALVGIEKDFIARCSSEQDECQKVQNKNHTISDSPLFLSLTYWQKKGLFQKYNQYNRLTSRRVDVYEMSNPQETFAVNFEHFILDPEFKCRKPTMYEYLSRALEHTPHKDASCLPEYRLPQTVTSDGSIQFQKSLDPKRLYQVHYLHAGKGKKAMSRWGHSMLRLVMCAPDRKVVDEKCLQDRAYHLVLSFRANVTNFSIDYVKGITGKYRSKMFVMPLTDVIKEYTVGELRELFSIPLKMDEAQKAHMMNLVLEHYWNYEGKYYFITNNCADETLNILRTVYFNIPEMTDLNVITPAGLRKNFEKFGIAEIVKNTEEAKRKGLYFESHAIKLERIFEDLIADKVLTKKALDYVTFLDHSTIEERKVLAQKASDPSIAGKLLFIEETIINRKLLRIQQGLGEILDEQDRGDGGELLDLFFAISKLNEKRSGLSLKDGYGLPLQSDNIFTTSTFTEEDAKELKEIQTKFLAKVLEFYPNQQKELQEMHSIKQDLFKKMMKKD